MPPGRSELSRRYANGLPATNTGERAGAEMNVADVAPPRGPVSGHRSCLGLPVAPICGESSKLADPPPGAPASLPLPRYRTSSCASAGGHEREACHGGGGECSVEAVGEAWSS